MSCPELLRTQSWLDGELDANASAAAKAHADSCAECRAFAADAAALGDLVRRDTVRHRAPKRLSRQIARALDAEPIRLPDRAAARRGFWMGALGGVGASALAAVLALFFLLPPAPASLVDSVTQAHVDALMHGRILAIASGNHHTVKPWFAGRVPLSPPVADFAGEGFALAGGRTDTVAGSPAAVLVYRHGRHEIDLFVWADRGSRLPGADTSHGYHSIFWKSGDLDFAAVSDTDPAELAKFVRLVKSERE